MNKKEELHMTDEEIKKQDTLERIVAFIQALLWLSVAVLMLRFISAQNIQLNKNEITIKFQDDETIERLDSMLERYNKQHNLESNRNEALVYIIEKYMLENETFGE